MLAAPQMIDAGTARVAVQTQGSGPSLLLIHGWPLSGQTFRKIAPDLARHFTCHLIDLPGAGETQWREEHDFKFAGQALAVQRVARALKLDSYAVLAHDTGATIARQLALIEGPRVTRLVLLNTEIPGHRPPWIRLFQASSRLPLSRLAFRAMLGSRAFLRSSMGFGGSFHDLSLIDGDFHAAFIQPLLKSPARLEGQIRYLQGIDWALVDSLAERHRQIEAPVLFIWGEDDHTFPIDRARQMVGQLPHCAGLIPIAASKLLLHEEQPAQVSREAIRFLRGARASRPPDVESSRPDGR